MKYFILILFFASEVFGANTRVIPRQISVTPYSVIVGDSSGVGTSTPAGTTGQALVSNGTSTPPSWGTVLTNPMTTGGDVIYGGASGVPTRLANGTSGHFLRSNGGTSAPSWVNPTAQTTASQLGSRALATNYTNTSLKTRIVMVTLNSSGVNAYATVTVNGATIATSQSYTGNYVLTTFAVGAGEVYRIDNTYGTHTIVNWVETN